MADASKPPTRPPTPVPPKVAARLKLKQAAALLRPHRIAEAQYRRSVLGIFRGVHAGILASIMTASRADGVRSDEKDEPDPADEMRDRAKMVLTVRVANRVADHVETKAAPAYDAMAAKADAKSRKAMTLIGIPIDDAKAGVADKIADMRDANLRLLTNASQDYLDDVRDVLEDPDNEGLRVEGLRALLVERAGVSESRAKTIAVDQTLKLASALSQVRQQAAGVTQFRWSTSLDERVRGNPGGLYPTADPSHFDLEGQVFDWDDPPEAGPDGEPCVPGAAILCRCVAIPVLPDEGDDEEPTEAAQEEAPDEDDVAAQ